MSMKFFTTLFIGMSLFECIGMDITKKIQLYFKQNKEIQYGILVSIKNQKCYVFDRTHKMYKNYTISTAEQGVSSEKGSSGIPMGLHVISDKIGGEKPIGMEFKARVPTGRIITIENEKPRVRTEADYVLTRIFRLKGCEEGINKGKNGKGVSVDTYDRHIYFHGTNEEYLIGTPASHGCIRMINEDIKDLFNFIQEGTPVDIVV